MKYRILELKDKTFIVQEKKFFFWYNLHDRYGKFFKFTSIQDAKTALRDYKKGMDMSEYIKITHKNALKIHSI